MSPTVVFLWISASGAGERALEHDGAESSFVLSTGKPATGAIALLRDYGAARGLNFVERAAPDAASFGMMGGAMGPGGSAANLANQLEAELEQAATSISALEEAAALERLARVEQTLLAHPDLPQAAWLLAETFALRARAAAHSDPETARRFEQRRAALEGPRATTFGEAAAGPPETRMIKLAVRGVRRSDELEIDGLIRAERSVELLPGLHQVRVLRGGRVVLAELRELPAGTTELALDVPALVPCSADDLAGLDGEALARGVAPPPGVACARFALVRPARRSIEIAMCSPRGCSPFVSWREQPGQRFRPIAEERHLPAWAGFAIAGATAVVATSLVLWQAGAFDEGRPSAARWEYGGLNPQGLRF